MFTLKKLHPPFGTRDAPVHEASYSEGIIKVVDGLCSVKNRDSRDYLLKMGYREAVPAEGGGVDAAQESKPAAVAVAAVEHQAESRPEPKRGVVGKVLSRLKRKRRR
ncbi:MAG: hypothetical protein ACYCPQ_00630 [Elusimicrobiota bacterium]